MKFSEYWYDKPIYKSPEPVKEAINHWKDAKVRKHTWLDVYLISSGGGIYNFNPLTKEWTINQTDDNGVMVCFFFNKSCAEKCFNENKPKLTLEEVKVGTKIRFAENGKWWIKTLKKQDLMIFCACEDGVTAWLYGTTPVTIVN